MKKPHANHPWRFDFFGNTDRLKEYPNRRTQKVRTIRDELLAQRMYDALGAPLKADKEAITEVFGDEANDALAGGGCVRRAVRYE